MKQGQCRFLAPLRREFLCVHHRREGNSDDGALRVRVQFFMHLDLGVAAGIASS